MRKQNRNNRICTNAEFIKQITVLIKKWNVVDQGNEILKDFHCYR